MLEAVVFVGEFLQVLTGGLFTAAVHRVVGFHSSLSNLTASEDENVPTEIIRVSCPYIIRGSNKAVIDFNGSKYSHSYIAMDGK